MSELVTGLLESRWGVLIFAVLLFIAQVVCVALFGWFWSSYPLAKIQFTDGYGVWLGVVPIMAIVDILFVWLCDIALLARRAELVKNGVDAGTRQISAERDAMKRERDAANSQREAKEQERSAAERAAQRAAAECSEARDHAHSMRMLAEQAGRALGWELEPNTGPVPDPAHYPYRWKYPPVPGTTP